MLRIIVISLVVANLLLLGFQGSKPAAKVEPKVSKTVVEDSSIPTIHLFSEMMQDQDLITGNRRCFSLGPFHSVEDKDEMRSSLMEVSSDISERETQALVEKGYWVFMPPYASLLEANQALLSLQALGLKDIGVIYDGEWKSAISLGYFLRHENALRRKKGLEGRGFAPMMRVQRHAEPRYWLDYEQNPGSGLIALDMQNRPNDFSSRAMPCPEQDPFESNAEEAQPTVENMAQVLTPVESDALPPVQEIDTGEEENTESTPDGSLDTLQNQDIEPEPEADSENGAAQPIVEDAAQVLTPAQEGVSPPVQEIDTGDEEKPESTPDGSLDTLQNQDIEPEPETPVEDDVGIG